jgi:phage FluMu protein gp41
MTDQPILLTHGLKIGDEVYKDAVLREATVGDLLEATEEAERAVATPDGYQLLTSPTALSFHLLRRQIVRVGTHEGPLTPAIAKRLHPDDLNLLLLHSQGIESAVQKELADRGRATGTPG